MNDLDLVRTVLDVPAPAPARMAAGRARLLAAASAGEGSSRSRRFAWPAGIAAVTAAAAAAVALAVPGGAVPAKPRVSPSVGHASLAAEVLTAAATAVAAQHVTEPAAKQWFYSQSISGQDGQPRRTDNEWITFDGKESAYYGAPYAGAPAQLIIHQSPAGGYPTSAPGTSALKAWDNNAEPITAYNALASLPASPSALLAAIDKELSTGQAYFGVMGAAKTTSQREFNYLGALLWNAYAAAPPSALAAVYKAIATIPGVTVRQGLRDAARSPAVGISANGGATELLLNPRTYQVIGINLITKIPAGADKVKAAAAKQAGGGGTGAYSIAYVRIAEVSRPGQR
jgi:hypothetical protein